MRVLIRAVVVVLVGCGCSAKPAKPEAPAASEYQIPMLLADGTIGSLTVEASPGDPRFVFCKELPGQLACLVDDAGRQVWVAVPFAPDPKAST